MSRKERVTGNDRPEMPEELVRVTAEQIAAAHTRQLHAGVDIERAPGAVEDCITALCKQAKVLAESNYGEVSKKKAVCPACQHEFYLWVLNLEALSKTMANTTKCADELARLIQFTAGKGDRRTEIVGMGWLEALTSEQLAIVQGWVADGERAGQ